MPSTRRHSYDLSFTLKIVAEAEAVNNNREIAREYGISVSWYANGETNSMCCLLVSRECQTYIRGSVQTKRSKSRSLRRLV